MQNDQTNFILNYAYTASVIGLTGGATWVALILFADFPDFFGLWNMVRLTSVSALVGGAFAAPLFGRDGPVGMALALIGGLIATIIGAMLAVAVVESPEAALWGPMMVLSALFVKPAVGGVWLLGMMTAHLIAAPRLTPESSGCP